MLLLTPITSLRTVPYEVKYELSSGDVQVLRQLADSSRRRRKKTKIGKGDIWRNKNKLLNCIIDVYFD